MANCPRCGSESIQIKRDTDVDWGRAVVGTVLFGVVGGAVGAVTGEDRNANVCLNCGATWKAAVLYEMLQFIKKETGKPLDLTNENERQFLNEVMQLMSEFSQEIEEIEREAKVIIENKKEGTSGAGCGCLVALLVAVIIGIMVGSGEAILISAVWLGLLFSLIGAIITVKFGKKSLEETTKFYEDKKKLAEKRFKFNVSTLKKNHLI